MRNIKIYSRSASLRKKKSINAMTVGEIAEGTEAKEDARNREKNTSRPDVSFFFLIATLTLLKTPITQIPIRREKAKYSHIVPRCGS